MQDADVCWKAGHLRGSADTPFENPKGLKAPKGLIGRVELKEFTVAETKNEAC